VRVAGRIAVEVLFWVALLVGLLWIITWLDLRRGPVDEDAIIPDGLEGRALRSTALVLPPAVVGLGLWLAGKPQARPVAVAAGALLVATASGWNRVDGSEVVEKVSLVAGIGLLALSAYGAVWRQPSGRHRVPWAAATLVSVVALLAIFLGGVGILLGIDLGPANRHPETESGYFYLLPGLTLTILGVGVLVRMLLGFRWRLPDPDAAPEVTS